MGTDQGRDDGDVDEGRDDGDDVDDEGGDSGEWTPPTKEEWEAAQAQLTKRAGQVKALRNSLNRRQREAGGRGERDDADDRDGRDDGDGGRGRRDDRKRERENGSDDREYLAEGALALMEAVPGLGRTGARRLARMLDRSEVIKDGDSYDFEDAIAALRDELPKLFEAGSSSRRRDDDDDEDDDAGASRSARRRPRHQPESTGRDRRREPESTSRQLLRSAGYLR